MVVAIQNNEPVRRCGWLMVAVVLLAGCQQDSSVEENTVAPSVEPGPAESAALETSSAPETSSAAEDVGITLTSGTWDDVQQLVADHAGRVVVVDMWSTSCRPCIAELPHLGELQRAHPDDVVCVSLSVDYVGGSARPPEFYRERVEEVLTACELTCRNILCTTEADVLFQQLDLPAIPAVFVYDRTGTLAQRFDASMLDEDSEDEEPFTYERNIVPLVDSLLETRP